MTTDTTTDPLGLPPASDPTADPAADAGMTTAPREEAGPSGPNLNLLGWLRWLWRQLTSMRVALLLLLLLSLAAIPGSLLPQRPVSPIKVSQYFRQHSTRAKIYDKLDLFNVFSSWWFAAIYILLFVSLAGCIVPRVWAHAKALRSRPPAAPRQLARMPVYARWESDADPGAVLDAAHAQFARRRFRRARGDGWVSAEKGYHRESGNLLFHISLFGVLVAVAMGSLFSAKGGAIVTEGEGQGFSNTLTRYDDFTSGPLFNSDDLSPFGFRLTGVEQKFESLGPERGAPRDYKAHVEYWTGTDSGTPKKADIRVNHPLEVDGTKVYLNNIGYAPDVTVKDAKGNVAYSGPTVFLPQDSNNTSTGVIKVPDVSPGLEQIGLDGLFLPTPRLSTTRGWYSAFPSLQNPVMVLTGYHGNLGMDSGIPQSVYQLDSSRMTQFTNGADLWRSVLAPGGSVTMPDGTVVTFNGVKMFANFQISHEPGKNLVLISVVAAIAGLVLSLFVRRRRVWVRASAGPGGHTVVEVAGLTKTEGGGLRDEVQSLVDGLRPAAPPVAPHQPEPDPEPEAEAGETGGTTAADPGPDSASEPAPKPERERSGTSEVPAPRSDPPAEPTGDTDHRHAGPEHAEAQHAQPDNAEPDNAGPANVDQEKE